MQRAAVGADKRLLTELINKDHNHYWNSPFVNHSGNPRFVWNTLSLTNGGPSFCLLSCEFSSFLPVLRTLVSDVGTPQKVEIGTFKQLVLCSVSSIGRLGFSTHNPSNKHPMAAAASKGFLLTLAQRGNYWPPQAFALPPKLSWRPSVVILLYRLQHAWLWLTIFWELLSSAFSN